VIDSYVKSPLGPGVCDIQKMHRREFKMMSPALQFSVAFAAAIFLTACATTPPVGSKKWHETRIAEIESAYRNNEVSEEAYLSLKNEADQTRVEHQTDMTRYLLYRRGIGYYRHKGTFAF